VAVQILTGVPGTGKTLYGIQKYIIPELKRGNKVYSNIDGLYLPRISILFDIDIVNLERCFVSLKKPERFWEELDKNAMCVLDESQNIFNNRDWQNENNKDCIAYLMKHRHYGHQVILICPTVEALDAGIRRVCEFTYKHKSFSMLGQKKTVKCAVFTQANLGVEPLKTFTWHHDTRIYDCYKSYFDEGTTEVKPKIALFRNFKLYLMMGVFAVSLVFVVRNAPALLARFHHRDHGGAKIQRLAAKSTLMPVVAGAGDNIILVGDSAIVGVGKYRRVIR